LRQTGPDKLPALTGSELEELWTDLAEADAFQVYRAGRYLSADPKRAVALFRRRIQPPAAADTTRIEQLVNDLQSPNAGVRRKAMRELRKHGEAAYDALARARAGGRFNMSLQVLLNKLESQGQSPEQQRTFKALQVLERIGTAEARALVENLSKGAATAPLTVEAKAVLTRWAASEAKGSSPPVKATVLWADLAGDDAVRAYRAIHRLAAAPKEVLPLLREHLKPAVAIDSGLIDRAVADLDSSEYLKREKATAELTKYGPAAEAALKKALAGSPSPELRRRAKELLEKLQTSTLTAEALQRLRALEVLERLDAAEATPLLEVLAKGAVEDRVTQEAKATLQRLARRNGVAKAPLP
jgi:hypothetical protein